MNYTHLTQAERYQIYAYKQAGKSIPEIAKKLGRNKSSLYRELKRNSGQRGYRPKQANSLATARLASAPKFIKLTDAIIAKIEEKIRLYWSPEQISGRLFKEEGLSISHETIYQQILRDKKNGGTLYTYLRHQKKRRKRYGSKSHDRRGQIKDRVSIDKRPKVVDSKTRLGDWEGDLVIGKNHKGALVTLAERKSMKVKIDIVPSKEANGVGQSVKQLLKGEKVFTITFDNGKEFANHKDMAEGTDSKIYFAHPYSSWERGLNENTNGLIRQFFRKGSSFENINNEDVRLVEDLLNNRPRKSLGYNTPNEIFSGERRFPRTKKII